MSSSSSVTDFYNDNNQHGPFDNRRIGSSLYVYLEDSRGNRNFEELITERGNLSFDNLGGQFDDVFLSIKNNLFQLSETENIEFTETDRINLNTKYCLDQVTNIIDILKSNIINLNNKKIKIDKLYYVNKKQYEKFSDSIFESVSMIDQMNNFSEKNNILKELLIDQISQCYNELKLDSLKDESIEITKEYIYMKKYLIELSSISNSTICQICLENQIEYFIDPCGHTICKKCAEKTLNTPNCHYCRTKKKELKKLFY